MSESPAEAQSGGAAAMGARRRLWARPPSVLRALLDERRGDPRGRVSQFVPLPAKPEQQRWKWSASLAPTQSSTRTPGTQKAGAIPCGPCRIAVITARGGEPLQNAQNRAEHGLLLFIQSRVLSFMIALLSD